MDGYEVCRRIREQPGHGVPAGRDGHRERRRAEDQGARGRRRRLPDQAGQPERAARPGRVAGPDQALPGHHQAPGRRARRVEPRAGGAGRDAGVPARADGPAAALPLAAAGRADRRLRRRVVPREPPARDRRRLLRPARVHPVRRGERAGGGDGRPRRVPRGARRPDLPVRGHPRAVRRRRPDGVLQRPGALRRRAGCARSG